MFQELLSRVSGYPGIFWFCVLSGIAIPVPEDIPLMYAGMQVTHGHLSWGPTILVAMCGVMLRDVIAYWAGRLIGEWLLNKDWVRVIIGPAKLARARKLIEDRGSAAVLVGRFFVGMRAPIFFVAGAMGVGFRKFLGWNTLGIVIAVPGVIILGAVFGEPLIDGMFWVMKRFRVVIWVSIVGLVCYVAWVRWRIHSVK